MVYSIPEAEWIIKKSGSGEYHWHGIGGIFVIADLWHLEHLILIYKYVKVISYKN